MVLGSPLLLKVVCKLCTRHHGPLSTSSTVPMLLEKITKSFHFFKFMCDLDGFQEVVRVAWKEAWYGDPMTIHSRKLKNIKVALVKLNKTHGNLHS